MGGRSQMEERAAATVVALMLPSIQGHNAAD
jgi:hypothetical protein